MQKRIYRRFGRLPTANDAACAYSCTYARTDPFPRNPVEKIGAFLKDAVCNQVWPTLAAIEAAISEELQPLWKLPERVAQLVGKDGWLAAELNASAKIYQSR